MTNYYLRYIDYRPILWHSFTVTPNCQGTVNEWQSCRAETKGFFLFPFQSLQFLHLFSFYFLGSVGQGSSTDQLICGSRLASCSIQTDLINLLRIIKLIHIFHFQRDCIFRKNKILKLIWAGVIFQWRPLRPGIIGFERASLENDARWITANFFPPCKITRFFEPFNHN